MRTISFLLFFVFMTISASAQKNFKNVVTNDFSDNVRVPYEVNYLVAKKNYKGLTHVVVLENQKEVGVYSTLRKVNHGEAGSTYVIEQNLDTIGLPNSDFKMDKETICNDKGEKLECLFIDLAPCECGPKTDIAFNRDSTTKNMDPVQHKMILYLDEVMWHREGKMIAPRILAADVDMADNSPNSSYSLSLMLWDGSICGSFPLSLSYAEDLVNKTNVYEVSLRDGDRFQETPNGYALDEKLISAYLVTKPIPPAPKAKGKKKIAHKKRVKIR